MLDCEAIWLFSWIAADNSEIWFMTLRSFWEILYRSFVILLPCFSDYLYIFLLSKASTIPLYNRLLSQKRVSWSSPLCSYNFLPNLWFSICGLWVMVGVKPILEGSVKVTKNSKGNFFSEVSTSYWLRQYTRKYWNLFWRCQGAGPILCSLPPTVCIFPFAFLSRPLYFILALSVQQENIMLWERCCSAEVVCNIQPSDTW